MTLVLAYIAGWAVIGIFMPRRRRPIRRTEPVTQPLPVLPCTTQLPILLPWSPE